MREGRRRGEVRDGERTLDGTTPGQDLAPDGSNGFGGQRARIRCSQSGDDLSLALRHIVRQIMPSFEVSDLEGGLGTLVEEGEDLIIEVIDPGTPIVQVHRDSCPAALS